MAGTSNVGGVVSPMKKVIALLVFVAAGASLTGCDTQFSHGPLAISESGGALRVAVCEDIRAVRIYAEQKEAGGAWERFVDASGSVQIESPSQILLTQTEFTMQFAVDQEPSFAGDSDLHLVVVGANSATSLRADFEIEGGLRNDGWLQPDGSITADPCPD